jgi:hypothetical protein
MLWLLLAAALFMRALVPQGYMAERDVAGAITVKVCGSGHVLHIPVGQGDTPDADERAQPPCAFAGLGTSALPPAETGLPVPRPGKTLFFTVAAETPGVVDRLPHPPARGPPLAA